MQKRKEVIDFCMNFEGAYEDYPFHDTNWTIMRHSENKKMFAAIYERRGNIWVNIKCAPEQTYFWRSTFEAVVPAYHMNKTHWNSIILDGSIPEDAVINMITESYELTKPKLAAKKN